MGKVPAIIGGMTVVFVSVFAGTAAAQLSMQPQVLDYEVTGLVATSCAATSGDIGAQITQALEGARPGDTRQVDFSLDCNKPFRVRVQSANGGLAPAGMSAQDRAAAVRDGLQPILDYAVGIDLPYRALTGVDERLVSVCQSASALVLNAVVTDRCALGGPDGVVVPGLSLNQPGMFQINLSMPDRPLVAGRLSDTIVIVIEAVR